ncbi:AraC family transcriptional regulator [Paenibacillus baekrokdamisoli]|uniref:AraC family transcriptional regulator n=1 Tax=Paenibacillus baekrokdamisoli TaxID=1712516 RepID=A0A3G9JM37_9BACL|nr:response regulator [Paenibacillus baekrokdamisoli]MBB3071927.1 two-component system response regulator YesN [Paenibacillus baekrokdamisoli]BBH24089.1 AraC family transcriptional regulator [Paenibacillus baekrokdamisoli]
MNIVIADDEKLILQGMAFIITQMNANDRIVAQCYDGEEALAFCLQEGANVDVLITDVCMPNKDGLDLITELARACPHIQTIVMSGFGEFDYVRRAMREGAIDYLLKPVIKNELQAVLDRIRNQESPVSRAGGYDKRESPLGPSVYHDNLLNALFHNNPGMAPDARAYLENRYGISEHQYVFLAAGVSIDEIPGSPFQQADRMLFQYFIRKMAEEALFLLQPEGGTVWQGQDGFVVLLFFVKKGNERASDISASLDHLLALLASHVQYPVTIGLSSALDKFSLFPELLGQVQASLRARLTMGTGKVIRYEDSLNLLNQWSVKQDSFHKVVMATVLGDVEIVEKELYVLLADLYKATVHPEVLLDMILRLFLRVEDALEAKGIRPSDVGLSDWGKLQRDLEKCPTWVALESEVMSRLTEWAGLIQEKQLEVKPTFITDAVNYIHIHYASDLTLAEVADVVGLYPTYLSEQFKVRMGVKFIDYVINIRMEKAKKLLRETNKPSFEICEKVGYATPAHFTKVFKNKVGCTPVEYREGWRELRKL